MMQFSPLALGEISSAGGAVAGGRPTMLTFSTGEHLGER
jgi:hypothetical protein